MRSWRFCLGATFLAWSQLACALPGTDLSTSPQTCRNIVSPLDYSAKSRRDFDLPLCPVVTNHSRRHAHGHRKGHQHLHQKENYVSPVVTGTSLSSLFGRQVVGGDDYTCAPDRPCKNKACCPKKTLQCNYGEEYCGTSGVSPNEVCWSNCDAKAECGKNAKVPGQKCPLNVCCGKWGFCGMTKDFCDVKDNGATGGCQSNCDQPGSKDKASDQLNRVIGYYEAWTFEKACQGMPLDQIPVNSLTHLYFSFASITPGDLSIVGMDGLPPSLFTQFTDLKKKNPALKTIIAIGGWTFNDPGPTQKVFSDMVSNSANRKKFIDNLMSFMRQYAFDGVDFDWEYPGADDRGGVPADGANFVQFLKELDDVNNKQPNKYVVSFTAPTSFWYLRHFDLKAVNYVDFVNVMSYDLHGVWDRENPIGSFIYGHTNLTEMRLAFDLFWRNDVPANKLNMGLGFYGRAFQLADPSCSRPGCMFKAGATKGGCSGESGILSYREIQQVIEQKKIKPVWDKDAGVKYITWNSDQWVSYDDADTFKQKKDLAADLGLGGFLIWAVDQDDDSLSALQAVISPKKLGDLGAGKDPDNWKGSDERCYITPCDGNCKTGDIKITEQKCGQKNKKSKLCCPLSGAPDPKDCAWRGNPTLCNGHCHDDEVMMQMNKWGDGGLSCDDGNKAYCCKSPLAAENKCYWAGVAKPCNGNDLPLTFSGSVLDILEDVAKVILRVVGRAMPLTALAGEVLLQVLDQLNLDTKKLYCCPKQDIDKWQNCAWYGKPGSCFDGHCPDMTFAQLTDSYFGGGETCGHQLSRVRTFCCEPKKDKLFLPVPLGNLFPSPPKGDNVDTDFSLETDGSSGPDQNPSDAAFQFVVLASPEELQVSLDKRDGSHWEVYGCKDSVTEGEHTVQMVCTDFSEDSNCHKISLGYGVPGTIVQMPNGCGPGKYAVAKSMVPSKQLLPRTLAHLAPHSPVVYDLTFDYDFTRVPRDLGSTQMRIDFSNQDDYWDTVVAAAASKHRKSKRSLDDVGGNHVRWLEEEFRDDYHFGGLEKRHLEERWFGTTVLKWLAQLVKPEIKREFTHKYSDTITAKIVDDKWDCAKGNRAYSGHLLAQALLNVKVESSFGFTLIVSKLELPLDLKQSFLTFYNKGEITGLITLEAVAKVLYSKKEVILNIPFPGASFRIPGIATLGPQLTVEGSVDASLSVAGTIETKLEIAKWEVRQVVPDDNNNDYKPKEIGPGDPSLDRTGDFDGIKKPEFYAGVQVQGDMSATLSAAAEFGVRFDSRWKVDPAAAAVVGEASVMAKLAAGKSTTANCPFTFGLQVGARLYARAKAPAIFGWPGAEYDITKWEKNIIDGGTCPDLGNIPTKRDLLTIDGGSNDTTSLAGYGSQGLRQRGSLVEYGSRLEQRSLSKRGGVYGPAFSIPVGNFFCPPSSNPDEQTSSSCSKIKPAWDNDKYLTPNDDYDDGDNDVSVPPERRAAADVDWQYENGTNIAERGVIEKRTTKKSTRICDIGIGFYYPTSGELTSAFAYGWQQPAVCGRFEFGQPLSARVAGTQYDSEHILEFQLLKHFFNDLDDNGDTYPHPNPNVGGTLGFCALVRETWQGYTVTIPNLDTAKGTGKALSPAAHLAAQFPTKGWKGDEYPVLEHEINTPAKGKAWGVESVIIDTSNWVNQVGTPEGARSLLIAMRALIGSRIYHNDIWVQGVMNKQVTRIRTVLDRLDSDILVNQKKNANWAPWPTMGLGNKWLMFMRGKFAEVEVKTMRVLNEFVPRLQNHWATDGMRAANQEQAGDSDAVKARKQEILSLIDDIEGMAVVISRFGTWSRPF